MGSYIPVGDADRREMLGRCGAKSVDDFYAAVPPSVRLDRLNLPAGCSELETVRFVEGLAGRNTRFKSVFRGAGAYRHYIPATVKSIVSKEEFVTAYTPYQAEISQGILQSIFEFQTMICDLTGLDVANASVYDGATAAAEALAMCREPKRNRALVLAGVNPCALAVIRTYAFGSGLSVETVETKDLAAKLGPDVACVYLQQPDFYGTIGDAEAVGRLAHAAGAKFVMGVNPVAAAILKSAGECGADVAVGEGQPLGLPLSWGGPYLGFMSATTAMMRKLPGRIVGETVDAAGNRAFVLTLQAREQHIRRERASSNICSNQNLCALTASMYLATMGSDGLVRAAESCHANAHYLAGRLAGLGFVREDRGEFFHEFVTSSPVPVGGLLDALAAEGILGGLELDGGRILWCATELNDRADIDRLVAAIGQAVAK